MRERATRETRTIWQIGVPSSEWSLFGKKNVILGVYRHVFSEHKFKLGFWAEPYPQDTLKMQKCANAGISRILVDYKAEDAGISSAL